MNKTINFTFIIILILLTGFFIFYFSKKNNKDQIKTYENIEEDITEQSRNNSTKSGNTKNNDSNIIQNQKNEEQDIQIIAENLEIPWEIVFLPNNSLLVTQRPGELVRINETSTNKITNNGVKHVGEGGLLGMVLDPDYQNNNYIYLYLTTETQSGLINRVERYEFNEEENTLSQREIILNNIPGAQYHDGGRMIFGPDGYLYITTGDATQENLAQDTNSLAGKILRINKNGSIPKDNPFSNEVYSYGHRNPQGLAFDNQNRLWASEHGPSSMGSGYDEINLIKKGGNYGWPEIQGSETGKNMISPIIQSGSDDTWAPAALEIIDNNLYFVGLRGSAVYQAKIENDNLIDLKTSLKNKYGRLRIVKQGPNGWLYLATSNRDGRGNLKANDDKIIKINPNFFNNN